MLKHLRISGWKPLVAALYAVAMLTLGFAHCRGGLPDASAVEGSSLQALAYALPDGAILKGTWPPICGQSKSGGPAQHHGVVPCDACQLTAAPGAIPPPPTLADAPRLAMKLPPVRALASVAELAALEPQSRGPPLLF